MEDFYSELSKLMHKVDAIIAQLNRFQDDLLQFAADARPDEFYQGEKNKDEYRTD